MTPVSAENAGASHASAAKTPCPKKRMETADIKPMVILFIWQAPLHEQAESFGADRLECVGSDVDTEVAGRALIPRIGILPLSSSSVRTHPAAIISLFLRNVPAPSMVVLVRLP